MFGISWAEFFVILLVAVVVVPARMWPDVARFLARAVKFVRAMIWRITDVSEQLKDQIELEQPIDELLRATADDMMAGISELRPAKSKKTPTRGRGKQCKK